MTIEGQHHVLLAMPAGGETEARAFYGGLLGLAEVPKPASLAARGGCWFERGTVRTDLGVETGFRPARKAHPALVVSDLEDLVLRLRAAGIETRDDYPLEGSIRTFVSDPLGNRIELMQATG
ncbi:glyoxalase [Phreatobacter sp.]|uniref:glyoxalase n=1 Tax=Phreatobacter sp. TaxID=1966341 RepID=UPI003F6E7C6E